MHDLGYDVFSLPRLHYSEQRRLAEGQAFLEERDRDRRIRGRGGDAERVQRRARAKQYHANEVSQGREELRDKWGVTG